MKLLIIASLENEIELLKSRFKPWDRIEFDGCQVYTKDERLYLATTGVGLVSSAFSSGILLSHIRPDISIMIGSGGALPGSGLNVGDMAVATSEEIPELGVLREDGLNDFNWNAGFWPNRSYTFDPELCEALIDICSDISKTGSGNFITVLSVSGDDVIAKRRALTTGAIVENMEGYAFAHACHTMGIISAQIRGISNMAGERDRSFWDISLANKVSQEAVIGYLERIL